MVTGLLSAVIQHNGVITKADVEGAVETAKMAYELISEVIGDTDDDEDTEPVQSKTKEPMPNYFQDY